MANGFSAATLLGHPIVYSAEFKTAIEAAVAQSEVSYGHLDVRELNVDKASKA